MRNYMFRPGGVLPTERHFPPPTRRVDLLKGRRKVVPFGLWCLAPQRHELRSIQVFQVPCRLRCSRAGQKKSPHGRVDTLVSRSGLRP